MPTEASEPPDPADPDADPESVARTIALRMLERQPRTRLELERAMAPRAVPSDGSAAPLRRPSRGGRIRARALSPVKGDTPPPGPRLPPRPPSPPLRPEAAP